MAERGEMVALARRGGNKYHAKKTTVDGITFDSNKEAMRWLELKALEKAGAISGLNRQQRVELIPAFEASGKHYRATTYIADFVYFDKAVGQTVYEDCKGYRTDVYRLKAKLFAYKFGMSIRES